MTDPEGHARFWELAEPWLARPEVTRSTMMGFPCLRVAGQFFASVHRDGSCLVIKLPAERVSAAVESGEAEAFAPNGRVFREWAAIPLARGDEWSGWLDEAYDFVRGLQ